MIADSYVYSRLTGNWEGFVTSGRGRGIAGPLLFSDEFDSPDLLPNNSGRLANDRKHQVKVSGYYSLPHGVTAGLVCQYFSGQPLSLYNSSNQFLIPRGTYGELPSTYSIDLHLAVALSIGSVSVVPVLDVFNLTNVQRALARNQIYNTGGTRMNDQPPFTTPTNPDFGKDVAWQRPRLVRVGMKAVF